MATLLPTQRSQGASSGTLPLTSWTSLCMVRAGSHMWIQYFKMCVSCHHYLWVQLSAEVQPMAHGMVVRVLSGNSAR